MTNLTTDQEAALARVREANKALKAAKVEANEVAKRARRDHIARHQAINDKSAAEAYFLHGVPYARIAEDGMGTTTHKTAKTAVLAGEPFVNKTSEEVEAAATPVGTPRFQEVDDGYALVTLQPEDFTPYKDTLAEMPDGERDWAFHLDGSALKPEDADDEATWLHPVVQVVMNTGMKAEVVEFLNTLARG